MANATSKDELSDHLHLTPTQGFSAPMTIKTASICDLHNTITEAVLSDLSLQQDRPSHQQTHTLKNTGCSTFLSPFYHLPLLYLLKPLAELLRLASVKN